MRASLTLISVLMLSTASASAQPRTTLDIYVTDVEGGNGTLFVTPAGESVLIDTGNANGAVRDAGRIMDAVRDAHLTQIDHLILTHYHADHFGGMEELAKQIPIKEFIDHGPNVQPGVGADWERDVYPKLYAGAKHTVIKPGAHIALKGVDWRIVASAGDVIPPATLPGADKSNPECAHFQDIDNNMEDPMSVASYISFGKFRTAHLVDLPRKMEFKLMCPRTSLPPVDLFLGLHHGVESSNSPVIVHALRPRVAIMNNGTRKGGDPTTMMSVHTSPGLEDLWQIHFSELSGQEYTQPGMYIANLLDEPSPVMPIVPIAAPQPGAAVPPAPVHNGKAFWIKVSAKTDGSFTVTNQRNGFSKTYAATAR
ncbi:MAG TPA: MBL fold metallo-hydrolase [Micropepsaceae bacterium]|nr:MBL fold metallo-hydrolase [Micropepsaceae bacterium]